MSKRFRACAAIVTTLCMTAGLTRQTSAAAPHTSARGPRVIPAVAFDTSPALRDISPAPEPSGPVRELPRHPRDGRRGSRHLGPQIDPVVQNFFGGPVAPSTSQSFDGLGNIDLVLPPDTNGDVGPNHYVQWVNLSFAIYSKGSDTTPPALLYGPASGKTVWTGFGGPCETRNDGDPIVLYDHLADRWFMSQFAIPNSFLGILFGPFYHCIAVSATPDPTGAYYRYQFQFDKLGDYPKFGVWPDGYYMAINQFEAITLQWAGQGVVAFDRERMLAGQPATMVYFDLESADPSLGGLLPSDLDGPLPPLGAPNYFAQMDDDAWGFPVDRLQLWGFHVDWNLPSNSTFTKLAELPTAPFDSNMCGYARSCIPQPGTSATLDAISDRLMYRLQYRNFGSHETLVVNHTVDADGTDHAGIRWYEIRNPGTAPQIYQQGTYAPDDNHRWMASAAMDGSGNMGLGFSVSGITTSPSVRYTGRLANDPLGALEQGEGDIVVGLGSQTHSSSRWGDYSMLAVDPTDDCTFWYTQEYYAATSSVGWQTRIGSFKFPSCGTVSESDLPKVTIAASDSDATEAGQTTGTFTITRSGDTGAPLTVQYTVSGTAVADSDYVAVPGSVMIDADSSTATVLITPIDDPSWEPDETVYLTVSPGAAYGAGSPSGASVTIISDDLPPDLIVSAISVPTTAGADTDMTVTDSTKNQGTGPASEQSATGFYLSTNTTWDVADLFLGSRSVPALGPGAIDSLSSVLHLPPGTVTGSYYVLAKADWNSAVAESLETNNIKASSSIKVGPDLIVSALSAPTTAAVNDAITVSDTTKNQGGGSAPASVTGFYLSTNLTLDASDAFLGSRAVGLLASGAIDSASTPVQIPATTASGTYYVLAKADRDNAVGETTETNNVKYSSTVKIGADLIILALSVPATSAPGTTISVSDTTNNQGVADSPASQTAFYLSPNVVLDATDVFLGSRDVGPLVFGATDAASTPVQIPATTAAGTYYVLAKADWNNAVAESTESNNVKYSSTVKIGADLVISAVSAPATAAADSTITVSDTTKNQGVADSPASETGFYLSTNAGLDTSDVFLGSRPVGPLVSGAADSASTQWRIPASTVPGTYYIIAKADWNGAVAESTESNNTRASSYLRIGPDLIVSSLTAPSSAVAGTTITASDTTMNQGGAVAAPSSTKFYLSKNLSLDSSDVFLGSRPVSSLGVGLSEPGSASLPLSATTTGGTYYIIAKADGDDTIVEALETNNTRTKSIQISAAP